MVPDWSRIPVVRGIASFVVKFVIAAWLLWFVPVPDRTEAHGVVSVEPGAVTVRATVPEADIELVRDHTRAVEVRLAERLGESVPAIVRRVDRVATVPSAAPGADGGNALAADPRDMRSAKTVVRVFQVDVQLQQPVRHVDVGGQAYLRFDHGRTPLARQWSRKLRRWFVARLEV